jgi:hypothetical protein
MSCGSCLPVPSSQLQLYFPARISFSSFSFNSSRPDTIEKDSTSLAGLSSRNKISAKTFRNIYMCTVRPSFIRVPSTMPLFLRNFTRRSRLIRLNRNFVNIFLALLLYITMPRSSQSKKASNQADLRLSSFKFVLNGEQFSGYSKLLARFASSDRSPFSSVMCAYSSLSFRRSIRVERPLLWESRYGVSIW